MAYLNDNYLKLKAGYLFPEIGRRVRRCRGRQISAALRGRADGAGLKELLKLVGPF